MVLHFEGKAMITIILGFVVIFTLIYFAYQYITNIDIEKLEFILDKKLPTLAVCLFTTIIIVVLIIVNF